MAKRILLVVRGGEPAARTSAALGAARLARESGGRMRVMYTRPLPPPRRDRYDRVVADTDREMTRIAEVAEERLGRLAAEVIDVPVERVVRFGRLARELRIEASVFEADLVALAAPLRPGLAHRVLAWYLEHVALGSKTPVVLLPIASGGMETRARDAIVVPAR